MTTMWRCIFHVSRIGAIFVIYAVFTLVGLAILKASYFWNYGIVPLNNGTYVLREYDSALERDSYNIYRMSDNNIVARDAEFVCFNDHAVHVNVSDHRKERSSGEYDSNMESDLIYIGGENFVPQGDQDHERLRNRPSLVDDKGGCHGFCREWIPVSFLTDFRDRPLLQASCGPLPPWLNAVHERPRP